MTFFLNFPQFPGNAPNPGKSGDFHWEKMEKILVKCLGNLFAAHVCEARDGEHGEAHTVWRKFTAGFSYFYGTDQIYRIN